MFDRTEMERVVDLQQRSYRLLRWVGDALQNGTLSFRLLHTALSVGDAATEWVMRNYDSIPSDMRPEKEEIASFANLFASYLQTSFSLIEEPGTQRVSNFGCYCTFCSYLVSARHLRVRNPDKKAATRAREMKALYLSGLEADVLGTISPLLHETLLNDLMLAQDLAFAAYGRELVRRSQFVSQGEGVLVLWREIAWNKGKVKKGFVLSAARILQAEERIVVRLKDRTGAGV